MKGIISALSIGVDGILAAGTFTRHVGLYDQQGSGECIAVFSIGPEPQDHMAGNGITQILWSPCGRYIYIIERRTRVIQSYDIRVTGKRLISLGDSSSSSSLASTTNQRLGADIISSDRNNAASGHEIWAGSTNGIIRVWSRVSSIADDNGDGNHIIEPTWKWNTLEDQQTDDSGVATSVIVHPSGTVAATCSGQRRRVMSLPRSRPRQTTTGIPDDDDDDDDEEEEEEEEEEESQDGKRMDCEDNNVLKIWKI